ncbi:MAG: RNA polymerase-binding protein DksA [Pseudomonadota bacterium]
MNVEAPIDPEYRPSDSEEFMCDRQKRYFKDKLIAWRQSILDESRETLQDLASSTQNIPDIADRASAETDRALELRTRDRQRKLISKIDAAVRRIDEGTYGYCEITGEPIGVKRLDARPIATLSLEAQEMHERREKVHRDA